MKKNIGVLDMTIRLVIGVGFLYIGFFDNPLVTGGLSQKIIGFAAFVPLLTAILRFCPLYRLVDIDNCKKK